MWVDPMRSSGGMTSGSSDLAYQLTVRTKLHGTSVMLCFRKHFRHGEMQGRRTACIVKF